MVIFPNAKINIGLQILSKRGDGFHEILTFFYPVNILKDILEICESRKSATSLHLYGKQIEGDCKDNLCIRAYDLLARSYKLPPVNINLYKNIDSGAGLGGGSSDAAHTLILLNKMFELNIDNKKLKQLALLLGSDCAFFIDNKPAFASSRGEVLDTVNFTISNKIEIQVPEIRISTKEAYSLVKPKSAEYNLKECIYSGIINWKNCIKNDFEECIFARYPEIAAIKEEMYSRGAVYASMTGSGSAVFGIF